ncbi:phage head closure protein [Phyllobacterium sp. SB3]|uniref:phage head closure protein n=1 Tax=Phyllobacterium sp. SB3 TaxID=3156073 RepID=UPI0032AFF74F
MRAGKLDNVIDIMRATDGDDGLGGPPIPGMGPPESIYELRAQIIEANTEEYIRAWGASTERLIIFRTRHVDDIQVGDFIKYDDRDFNIKEIKPIGRRRGLEIRCVARGA